MAVKVVVIDDTDHVREMLASMLSLDGFDVVAQGKNGDEALELAERHQPDVIVIDYSMPMTNGLEASKHILKAMPNQPIILYTAYIDDVLKQAAKEAGIAICVGKVEGLETLERSISELCLQLGK